MAGWKFSEQETVVRLLWEAVERAPDHKYLHFSNQSYTYAESYQEIIRLAQGLRELGVKPGDTVTMMLDNSADAVFIWHAITQIGAIAVAINTALKGDLLRHVVTDAASSVFIGEAAYIERLVKMANCVPNIRRAVARGASDTNVGPFKVSGLASIRLEASGLPRVDARPSDICALLYTGGTTGLSKGCMISQNYLVQSALQNNGLVERRADETWWNPLPIFHANLVATGIVGPMLQCATSSISERFSLNEFWPAIKESGARIASLNGTMQILVAKMPDTEEMRECRGQLRALHALPMPQDIERIWIERFGLEIAGVTAYGLTECHLVTHFPGGTCRGAKPGSAGKRSEEFDTRIFDDQDRQLGPGEVGEVVVRPLKPHRMFEGYWRRPEETLRAHRNMWFHTGDLGMFDEDGYLFFVDRKKDYLCRPGKNISSEEVEIAYRQHEEIAEVAVHAVFAKEGEDDLKVTAVLREGSSLTPRELFNWSIERIPCFALPRYIEFREELPKGPVGRVQKFQLREDGCTPTTWDRQKEGVFLEQPQRNNAG
jgi:carnitine-CoA ligase